MACHPSWVQSSSTQSILQCVFSEKLKLRPPLIWRITFCLLTLFYSLPFESIEYLEILVKDYLSSSVDLHLFFDLNDYLKGLKAHLNLGFKWYSSSFGCLTVEKSRWITEHPCSLKRICISWTLLPSISFQHAFPGRPRSFFQAHLSTSSPVLELTFLGSSQEHLVTPELLFSVCLLGDQIKTYNGFPLTAPLILCLGAYHRSPPPPSSYCT